MLHRLLGVSYCTNRTVVLRITAILLCLCGEKIIGSVHLEKVNTATAYIPP